MKLVPVVEGHGEVTAIPVLLRRILEQHDRFGITVERPIRVKRTEMVRNGEVEGGRFNRYLQLASSRAVSGAVLVVMDADDDLPCQLGPAMLQECQTLLPHSRIGVVFANRCYEAWFLAGAAGFGAEFKGDPDGHRSPVNWVKEHLQLNYSKTIDQERLSARLDIAEAVRTSASFGKLVREVLRLTTSS